MNTDISVKRFHTVKDAKDFMYGRSDKSIPPELPKGVTNATYTYARYEVRPVVGLTPKRK